MQPSAATELQQRDPVRRRSLARLLLQRQFTLTLATCALFAYFSLFAAHFFSVANVYDMARVITYLLIVAVGMTYLFIAGELDLSVGSTFALAEVFMAILITHAGVDPWVAAGCAVVLGAVVGAINGFLTTVVGVSSFIVTLGMMSMLRGVCLVLTAAVPIVYPNTVYSSFFDAASGRVAFLDNMPMQIIWGLAVLVVGAFVLRYTRFGHHVYATGGNAKAARAVGINTRGIKFACFVATGACCGLIGALEGGWLHEGFPTTGTGFELQVIAAVIIGGVALTGGEGGIYGTFLGAAIIGMLYNGLTLLGVGGNWTQFLIGFLIVSVASTEVGLRRQDEIRLFFHRVWRRSPMNRSS